MMTKGIGLFAGALLLAGCATAPAPRVTPAAQVQALIPGTYNDNNPFAKIIRGEAPAAKVYEDKDVVAFMDINPVERGHVLVISKTSRARNLLEIDLADLDKIMAVARRVGQAEMIALGANGFSIEQNNGEGQTVYHLHVHVHPRWKGVAWGEKGGPRQTVEQLTPDAKASAAAMPAN